MVVSDDVRAYHEAGHAVAALTLGASLAGVCLGSAMSERTGLPLDGYCDPIFDETQNVKETTWKRIVVTYAGSLAEAEHTGQSAITIFDEQRDDHDYVQAHVQAMMPNMGAEELNAWRLSAWNKAYEIITARRQDVEAVAHALLRKRALSQANVSEILAHIDSPVE